MIAETAPWSLRIPLGDLRRGPLSLALAPEPQVQSAIARSLKVDGLSELQATVRLAPWLEGAEVSGDWSAVVTQVCGVSLEPFENRIGGAFQVRCVPLGSPLLRPAESEVEIDLDADDPPDALDHDWVDVAAYVVEHLALEIDPFPRKPGVEFIPPAAESPPSPFGVLAKLQPPRATATDAGSGEGPSTDKSGEAG